MIGRIEYEVLKRMGICHKSIYPVGYRYEAIPPTERDSISMARDIIIYYAIRHKVLSSAEIGDRLGYSRHFAHAHIRKLMVEKRSNKDLQNILHDMNLTISALEGIYLPATPTVKVRPFKDTAYYTVCDPSISDKSIVVKAKNEKEAVAVYRSTIHNYDMPKPMVSPYVLPGIKTSDITTPLLISVVSRYMGVSEKDILGKGRVYPIVRARHILRYIICDMCHMTARDIASQVNADRTSVLRSLQVVSSWMRYDTSIRQDINNIKKTINILT